MPWVTPSSVSTGDVLTAARYNSDVVGNAAEVAPIMQAWTSVTPTLTAASVNPVLGSGSTAAGSYVRIGKFVIYEFRIYFGTSGVSAGTGAYYIGLPVARKDGNEKVLGNAILRDASAGFIAQIAGVFGLSGDTSKAALCHDGVLNTGAATPWTWAASDQITGVIMYETP